MTGTVTGTNAAITGDDTAETITIGIDNGLLTHNFPTTGTGFANATDFDSDRASSKTLPAGHRHARRSTARAATTTSRRPQRSTSSTGGDGRRPPHRRPRATTRSRSGRRRQRRLASGTTATATDTNDGDAGIDEHAFNGGNTTDDMTVKNDSGRRQRASLHRLGATSSIDMAATRRAPEHQRVLGQRQARHRRRHDAPDHRRRRPRQRHHHHRRRRRPRSRAAGRRHAQRRRRRRPHRRQPGQRHRERRRRRRHARVEQRRRHRQPQRPGRPRPRRGQHERGLRRRDDAQARRRATSASTARTWSRSASTSRRPRCSSSTGSAATTRWPPAPGLGALISVVADGGPGNDAFTGGDESDTYFGGLGDDTLDPGRRHRRRGRRPGRQRHAEGPRRLCRPRPRRQRHRQRDRRPRGRARRRRDRRRPAGAAGGRHHGHRGARDDQARHVEAQEGRLHREDPRELPGLRGRRLQGHPRRCRPRARCRSAARASTPSWRASATR